MAQKLGLYTHVLPTMERAVKAERGNNETQFYEQIDYLNTATVFDCRSLPTEFVDDTGDAILHEMEQTAEKVRLPYPVCYFEFDDESSVIAYEVEVNVNTDGPSGITVEVRSYGGWRAKGEDFIFSLTRAGAEFRNGVLVPYESPDYQPKFLEFFNTDEEGSLEPAAKRLLGVLGLLKERLIIERFRPDQDREKSARRAKKGMIAVSGDTRVLTVNVPAVRYAVSRNSPVNPKNHESPRLHWRRGHWRVIHRGSEFEANAWVKKCLVGNPDKGFVRASYKLVHQMPMPGGSSVVDFAANA